MFNQQFLIACLIVLICLYLAVNIYSWWQSQKANSNEPEPKGHKEFNYFLRKENEEIKGMVIELDKAYSESQRELRGLKDVSIRFIKDFESLEEGKDVTEIITAHYGNLKTLLK